MQYLGFAAQVCPNPKNPNYITYFKPKLDFKPPPNPGFSGLEFLASYALRSNHDSVTNLWMPFALFVPITIITKKCSQSFTSLK